MLFAMSFEDKATAFGMKCLTVAGAFVVGWVLGILLGFALNRWLFKNKMHPGLKKALNVVCAAAVAIIVAIMIFGGGTGGGAGPGGTSDGNATSTGSNPDKSKSGTPPIDPKDEKKPVVPSDPRPTEVTIRVTVLGGTDVRDEKFYLLDDDRTAKSLRDIKDAVQIRRAKDARKTVVAVLRSPPPNRVPLDHGAVSRLVAWVQDEAKLDITFPAEK